MTTWFKRYRHARRNGHTRSESAAYALDPDTWLHLRP